MSTRLVIKTAEITPDGILIRSMNVIDGVSGETIKVAKLTPQLLEFLQLIEIEVDNYFQIIRMKEENPHLKKLINTFKLNT
jgi:hypothetical protein